jgi:hypothetical protein
VNCSLIDEYVKKPSAHGMSTFNGSSVRDSNILIQALFEQEDQGGFTKTCRTEARILGCID